VGSLAEWRGRVAIPVDKEMATATNPPPEVPPAPKSGPETTPPVNVPVAVAPTPSTGQAGTPATTLPTPAVPLVVPPERTLAPPPPEPAWMKLTAKDTDELDYGVPPDQGIVSPFAGPDEAAEDFMKEQVDTVRSKLATWPPGAEGDDLRCIRNLLYVAAVPDAIQLPVERYLPRVVYEHLIDTYPKDKLVKILTYIVLHPEEGMVIDDISDLGIEGTAGDPMIVRERAYLYAIKMIARLTGRVRE
jgi:hypothetical protein